MSQFETRFIAAYELHQQYYKDSLYAMFQCTQCEFDLLFLQQSTTG